jgi:WD40 repeat protein
MFLHTRLLKIFKIVFQIRVFNYNTLERVHNFDAHSDYVRAIAVHPTQPFILTSSGKKTMICVFVIICAS